MRNSFKIGITVVAVSLLALTGFNFTDYSHQTNQMTTVENETTILKAGN